jgi:hypothetical protein
MILLLKAGIGTGKQGPQCPFKADKEFSHFKTVLKKRCSCEIFLC